MSKKDFKKFMIKSLDFRFTTWSPCCSGSSGFWLVSERLLLQRLTTCYPEWFLFYSIKKAIAKEKVHLHSKVWFPPKIESSAMKQWSEACNQKYFTHGISSMKKYNNKKTMPEDEMQEWAQTRWRAALEPWGGLPPVDHLWQIALLCFLDLYIPK